MVLCNSRERIKDPTVLRGTEFNVEIFLKFVSTSVRLSLLHTVILYTHVW